MKCDKCWLCEEDYDAVICKIDLGVIDPDSDCKFSKVHRAIAILFDAFGFL